MNSIERDTESVCLCFNQWSERICVGGWFMSWGLGQNFNEHVHNIMSERIKRRCSE